VFWWSPDVLPIEGAFLSLPVIGRDPGCVGGPLPAKERQRDAAIRFVRRNTNDRPRAWHRAKSTVRPQGVAVSRCRPWSEHADEAERRDGSDCDQSCIQRWDGDIRRAEGRIGNGRAVIVCDDDMKHGLSIGMEEGS
jgi:hypothetical protein